MHLFQEQKREPGTTMAGTHEKERLRVLFLSKQLLAFYCSSLPFPSFARECLFCHTPNFCKKAHAMEHANHATVLYF